MTTPNESVISEESREAAEAELGQHTAVGTYVQALLNASTARLREQVNELTAANQRANALIGDMADEAASMNMGLRLHLESEQNANRANVKVITELREERDAALNSFHAANKERMAWKDKPA